MGKDLQIRFVISARENGRKIFLGKTGMGPARKLIFTSSSLFYRKFAQLQVAERVLKDLVDNTCLEELQIEELR